MPEFSSDYIPESERLHGAPFALAWTIALAFCCAFWSVVIWAAWQVWRLASGG